MAAKTYNQHKEFFEEIADKHFQIHSFGMGEEHEINGAAEEDRKYVKMWVIPIDNITRENTIERTFEFLVFDLVHKDESNEDEVISDCEQILEDVLKILENESDDYEIINEPQSFPFTEKYADDVSGWRAQVVIQTDRNNNYCDVPADDLNIPDEPEFEVLIKDQDGNTLQTFNNSGTYTVEVLEEIVDTIDSNELEIIDPIE